MRIVPKYCRNEFFVSLAIAFIAAVVALYIYAHGKHILFCLLPLFLPSLYLALVYRTEREIEERKRKGW